MALDGRLLPQANSMDFRISHGRECVLSTRYTHPRGSEALPRCSQRCTLQTLYFSHARMF